MMEDEGMGTWRKKKSLESKREGGARPRGRGEGKNLIWGSVRSIYREG